MNRIDLSSIVNLGKNSPLLLALDTSGCKEGDIYDSKKPIVNRTQVIGSNFRGLSGPDLYSFESEVQEADLHGEPHHVFAVCYRSA